MSKKRVDSIKEPFEIDEITALIRYASEMGIDPDGKTLCVLDEAVRAYTESSNDPNVSISNQSSSIRCSIIENYAKLAKHTYPVTGRTLIATAKVLTTLRVPIVLTIGLVVLVVAIKAFGLWLGDLPEPEEGLFRFLFNIQNYLLNYLSPFLWGSLGACVYLFKRIYDLAKERCFDDAKFHGWFLRVTLGAILGAIVYHIYDSSQLIDDNVNMDADALAFFTGLGVKIVYGAFERTIEVIAKKLNLDAVKRQFEKTHQARSYILKKIEEIDPEKYPDRHQFLINLLEELDQERET